MKKRREKILIILYKNGKKFNIDKDQEINHKTQHNKFDE
jgi:hypothetical protein